MVFKNMEKNNENFLNDGLGFDSHKNLFYMINYGWFYDLGKYNKNIIDKKGFLTGKSGITKHDVYRAMSESSPTRGRLYPQIPLWGFLHQKIYFPAGTTIEQANQIVKKADFIFKESMKERGWTEREIRNDRKIGTEFYTVPAKNWKEWEEKIREVWKYSISFSFSLALGEEKINSSSRKQIDFLVQKKVDEDLAKYFEDNHRGVAFITMGYGKTRISFLAPYKYPKFKDKSVIHYSAHNIYCTKEMARNHAQYADETSYSEGVNRIVICSDTRKDKDDMYFGIDCYSASDPELGNILERLFLSGKRLFFYICRESHKEFSSVYNQSCKNLNITQKPGSITDEIQNFTGSTSSKNTSAVYNSCGDCLLGLTATLRTRPSGKKKNGNIYNDDTEYFGEIAVEIGLRQAIREKRNCPLIFKFSEPLSTDKLYGSLSRNEKILMVIGKKTEEARGKFLRTIATIVKAIREDNRKYFMAITSLIEDTKDAVEVLEILQSEGEIPSDFLIIKALASDKQNVKKQYGKSKKLIIVGTPWISTGLNLPKIDGITSFYNFGSSICARQFLGRGLRYLRGKILHCYIQIEVNSTSIPSMLIVAGQCISDDNTIEEAKIKEKSKTRGGSKPPEIDFDFSKDDGASPAYRAWWDEIYKAISFGEIVRISTEVIFSSLYYKCEEAQKFISEDPNIFTSKDYVRFISMGKEWRKDFHRFLTLQAYAIQEIYRKNGGFDWFAGLSKIKEIKNQIFLEIDELIENSRKNGYCIEYVNKKINGILGPHSIDSDLYDSNIYEGVKGGPLGGRRSIRQAYLHSRKINLDEIFKNYAPEEKFIEYCKIFKITNKASLYKFEGDEEEEFYRNKKNFCEKFGIPPMGARSLEEIYSPKIIKNCLPDKKKETSEEEKEKVLKMLKSGKNVREISRITDLHPVTVEYIAIKNGFLVRREFKKIDEKIKEKALEMMREGISNPEISRILGISKGVVSGIRSKNNLNIGPKVKRTDKFTREKIVSMIKSGVSNSEISRETGVTPKVVSSISKREGLELQKKNTKEIYRKEILKKLESGMGAKEIHDELKVPRSIVTSIAIENDMSYSQNKKKIESAILENLKLGKSREEIMTNLSVTRYSISIVEKKNGLANPSPSNRKVPDKTVKKIERMLLRKDSQIEISKKFNVSKGFVCLVSKKLKDEGRLSPFHYRKKGV
jgi:DNA-binding CsgD family transcriptional regulator